MHSHDDLQQQFEALIADAESAATHMRGERLGEAMQTLTEWIAGAVARGIDAAILRGFRQRLEHLRGLCGLLAGALLEVLTAAAVDATHGAPVHGAPVPVVYGRDGKARDSVAKVHLTKRYG